MDRDAVILLLEIIAGCIAIFAIGLGVTKCTNERYEAIWNNGYCECGGHWAYEQAVGHIYHTTYVYHCDTCGKRIEISYLAN